MAKTTASTGDSEEILKQAQEAYERARAAWHDNHEEAKADLKFARLGQQWDDEVEKQRKNDRRPCLTFNKMPAFIRQVVNDARQNKPAIKVHPQDSNSDPRTAEIVNGLIRNIEVTSDADIAYDTAIEHAVGQGFGFWRINTAYTCDDSFAQDIVIERIANPFTVYGDPASTAADSSDWNEAFIATTMTKKEFERDYPDAEMVDWEADFKTCGDGWVEGEKVTVAEYWTREKVKGSIIALSDGSIVKMEEFKGRADEYAMFGIVPIGEPRETETYKVTQRIMTGAEVLKTVDWAGKYIPIIPVYGDEVIDDDGKRHFRSLIRDAKSAQQMFNYWRTTTTELVALAPKAPWVGEERAFEIDPNWDSANSTSHSKLMVPNGAPIPQRQPFAGVPAGALQEAMNAADDMKSIIGIYDASLGARSNETSGKAIMARQREGDVSTFHFIDNLSRAIRHSGRVLLDLIAKVYSTERVIRVLGEDMQPQNVNIGPANGQQMPQQQGDNGISHIFDLAAGKYDLTVAAGPSFTSRREEVREILSEASNGAPPEIQAVLIPRIAKLMDVPDADDIAQEMQQAMAQAQGGKKEPEPGVQEITQQAMQAIQQLRAENQQLQQQLQDKSADRELEKGKLDIDYMRAETERLKAVHEMQQPTVPPSWPTGQS